MKRYLNEKQCVGASVTNKCTSVLFSPAFLLRVYGDWGGGGGSEGVLWLEHWMYVEAHALYNIHHKLSTTNHPNKFLLQQ